MKKKQFIVNKFIDELSRYSSGSEGVTRLPFTQESSEAFNYIKKTMTDLGLSVFTDKYGTVQGHLDGEIDKSIIIASHYDSVKSGGKYDGVLGIAVGLAVADYFLTNKIKPKFGINILALNDEEGVRFNKGFLSSKAITDTLNINDIRDKESGETLEKLLKYNLYGNDEITLSTTLSDAIKFIEVHIEQGFQLEGLLKDIGIVDNIVGIKRFHVTVCGFSGHAGTTPMEYRSDALVAACKIITDLQNVPQAYEDLVLTVGYMSVSPNAINVIPGSVHFSIDVRSANQKDLDEAEKWIKHICLNNSATNFPSNNSVMFERNVDLGVTSLSKKLGNALEEVVKEFTPDYLHMNSGAGHDSQIFAPFMETAMLFVPSHLGISHNPKEYTEEKYINKVTGVLCEFFKNDSVEEEGDIAATHLMKSKAFMDCNRRKD